MSESPTGTKPCKFCAEDIAVESTSCQHCGSKFNLPKEHSPAAFSTKSLSKFCPVCNETIKIEAVKCRHCLTDLTQLTEAQSHLPKGNPSASNISFEPSHTKAKEGGFTVGLALGISALSIALIAWKLGGFWSVLFSPVALIAALIGLAKKDRLISVLALLIVIVNLTQYFSYK